MPRRESRARRDRAAEVAVADVVEREVAILGAGRSPVDAVDVVPVRDEPLGEALAGQEIEHVVPIDERRHEQDRRA